MTAAPRVVAVVQPGHLGDIVSCLPMAAVLRREFSSIRIVFVARRYVRDLVEACAHVDEFLDCDAVRSQPGLLVDRQVDVILNPFLDRDFGRIAKQARIRIRVGNLRRLRTLHWANRFMYSGSRNLPVHVANLNLKHLRPLGIRVQHTVDQLAGLIDLSRIPPLQGRLRDMLVPDRFNLILHTKSNKNGTEWPASCFNRLAELLPPERFRIFLTGRARERDELAEECPALLMQPHVVDLIDQLDLSQLIAFIAASDGLVASSTGPLHIAGAAGIHALGLFPEVDPFNVTRWHPIGVRAEAISSARQRSNGLVRFLQRIDAEAGTIEPSIVAARVLAWREAIRQ